MSSLSNTSQLAQQALWMAQRDYRVFPCYGVRDDLGCTCNNPNCNNIGKHPWLDGFQKLATTDPDRILYYFRQFPGCNYGVLLGPHRIAVDLDGPDGYWDYLDRAGLIAPPQDTLTVRSGSENPYKLHVYHTLPPGHRVMNGKCHPQIDIKTDTLYVIGPGSRHRSGGYYRTICPGPVIPTLCPPQFLQGIKRRAVSFASSCTEEQGTPRKASRTRKAKDGPGETLDGPVDLVLVNQLAGEMAQRFPITAYKQRYDLVVPIVGYLYGTGRDPATIQAVGRIYLAEFHALGVISTPLGLCYASLNEVIGLTEQKHALGTFQVKTEQDHVNAAILLGCQHASHVEFLSSMIIPSKRAQPSLTEQLSERPGGAEGGTQSQELYRGAFREEDGPGESSERPGGAERGAQSPELYRGAFREEDGPGELSEQPESEQPECAERAARAQDRYRGAFRDLAFVRSLVIWMLYKLLEFPNEEEILLTDGQIKKLMLALGHPIAEWDDKAVRRLRDKFVSRPGHDTGLRFPVFVRTKEGRLVQGRREPSQFVPSDRLIELLEQQYPEQ